MKKVLGIILLSLVLTGCSSSSSKSSTKSSTKNASSSSTAQTASSTASSKSASTVDTSSGIEKYNSGSYPFIVLDDLAKYAANMNGVNVSFVAEVRDLEDDCLQIALGGGFMDSNVYVDNYSNFKSHLEKEKKVALVGTVGEIKDYSFVGNSYTINAADIVGIGDDAAQYDKGVTDDALAQYLKLTPAVANVIGDKNLSPDEFKSLCGALDYEDILRNPDSYKDGYCLVSGTVDQIIEGFFKGVTIYVTDANGNKWSCSYSYNEGDSHVLEGDAVNFYGKIDGTTTAKTLLGKQVEMPDVTVKYLS